MISIEDRLSHDAKSVRGTTAGDWADVIDRADQRGRRQQRTMRVAVLCFLVLIGTAIAFGGGPTETASAPADLPPAAESVDTVQAPSRVPAYAALVLAWGASLAVAVIAFFGSPRSFRAPYLTQRSARVVAAMSWVSFWNLLLLATSGVVITVTDWSFASELHSTSASVLGGAIGITVLLILFGGTNAEVGCVTFIALSLFSGFIWQLLIATGDAELSQLIPHVLLGLLITVVPVYTYRQLGFSIEWSRFERDRLRSISWRRALPGVMIIGGMVLSVASIAPARVLSNELVGSLPEIEGYSLFASEPDSSIFNAIPGADFAYTPDDFVPLSGEIFVDELQEMSREYWIPVLEVLVPGEDHDALVPRAFDFEPTIAQFELWTDLTDTPLGLVPGNSETPSVTIGPLDRSPFDRNGRLAYLGLSLAVIGAMVLWSETAISRFTFGPKPWTRRSARRERTGWLVFWSAAAGIGALGLGPLLLNRPIPDIQSESILYVLALVAIGYIGTRIVTPAPPEKPPEPPQV